MATPSSVVQLSVVPDAQKGIEYTIDAPRRLAEAIEAFKQNRVDAETELAQSLSKDLAAAPLNVDSAIEKHKAWKAKDELLVAKIKTAEELRQIIEKCIEELKTTQAETLKAVIRRKLDQLEEAAKLEGGAKLIEGQIKSLTKLLDQLEKPASAAAAKSKKE
jgi:RecA/RadA recombinase